MNQDQKILQLESGFLEIDEKDTSAILRYFMENEESFRSVTIDNQETGKRYLWMLSEILNSAFDKNDQKIIKSLTRSTIRKYQEFSTRFNSNIRKDSHYKALLINVVNDQVDRRNYFVAWRIFKILHQIEPSNNKIKALYLDSKRRIRRTLSRLIGIAGVILVLLKYLLGFLEVGGRTELLIIGYTGASALIVFGIVEIVLSKKRTK